MILSAESHLDHDLSEEHVAFLLATFGARDGFFIATVELPAHLGDLKSALYGPLSGDEPVPEAEVHYAARGARTNLSRLIAKPSRPTRLVTVIAGPQGPGNADPDLTVLYTAFGGPCSPREATDPSLASDTSLEGARAVEESRAFWAEHALASLEAPRGL